MSNKTSLKTSFVSAVICIFVSLCFVQSVNAGPIVSWGERKFDGRDFENAQFQAIAAGGEHSIATTLAVGGIGGSDENTFYQLKLDANNLASGNNVLAVETHQISPTSSDISFALELIGSTEEIVAEMKKGPYLIYPGNPTQMTVLWQLDFTGTCRLEWGLDTSYSVGSVLTTQYGTDHQHKYTIGTSTPLTPGTKYFYRVEVEVGSGDYYTGTFLTAPGANAEDVKFLAYGDTRTDQASHNNVCAGIVSTYTGDPNYQTFLVHVGDWVNTGDSEFSWATEFFSRLPQYPSIKELQANLPLQGCMGNHEISGIGFKKYWPYPYVADRYWSFDYGPVHVVIVDQYVDYGPGSAQLTWIEDDLSASMKDWKIIVLHEPGWSAGGGHGNNIWVQDYIQPLCERYGVDIIFCGHNHNYARADVMGVQHITTGGGGAPLHTPHPSYPFVVAAARTYEFCKIDIRGHELTFEAVKPDGTIIDRFVLLCEPVLVVEIDIKPGSYPNAINLGSHGLVPVAILSSEDFDATTVDLDTIELAGASVAVRGKSNKYMAHQEDVDGDGLVDLLLQVVTADINPALLQQDGDVIYAVLTGNTSGGEAIEGKDKIIIVPPK